MPVLGAALCVLVADWSYLSWLRPLAALLSLSGICLLAGGWPLGRWIWPALAVMLLAVPLAPATAAAGDWVAGRLCVATAAYALVVCGIQALASEGLLILNVGRLAAVDAGIGWALVPVSLAVGGTFALSGQAPRTERILLAASALPLALLLAAGYLAIEAGSLAASQLASGPVGDGDLLPEPHWIRGVWLIVVLLWPALWLERQFLDRVWRSVGGPAAAAGGRQVQRLQRSGHAKSVDRSGIFPTAPADSEGERAMMADQRPGSDTSPASRRR